MGTGLTSLSRAELRRRIVAARNLRDLSQEQLDDLFDADGLGKAAGRLERGDGRITLNRALLDGLVRNLRVPERWFTERDVDRLVYHDGDPGLDGIAAQIRALDDRIRNLQAALRNHDLEAKRRIAAALATTQDTLRQQLG